MQIIVKKLKEQNVPHAYKVRLGDMKPCRLSVVLSSIIMCQYLNQGDEYPTSEASLDFFVRHFVLREKVVVMKDLK